MPFIKKNNGQGSLASTPPRSIFIGRAKELLFFVQNILKPEEPTHNILSIWGQGGVGKTTLLLQFRNQAGTADFEEYCFAALVDDRQATPANMMEKFAHQLHLSNKFEKALNSYKEALHLLPVSRPPNPLQKTMLTRAPDIAGALVEGIPVAGPLLREGAKVATGHLLDHYQTPQEHSEAVNHDGPLETLTRVFISELNHLAATKGALPSVRTKRERRILLFFDTFEQVADEAVPWLLHYVLEMEINPNIVFIVAGRDPLERSTVDGAKQWLPYYDSHTIFSLPLRPFTQEETSAYLAERGITTMERIETIWHLSHGLPLYLSLLASSTQGTLDPTKDVVDNFLRRIPDQEQMKRQLALDAALFSRPFNLDDLEAFPYLTDQNRPSLYTWLIRQPFVRASSLSERYIYHDLVQELFQRHVLHSSPKTYYAARRTLATYYQGLLEHLQTIREKNMYRPSDVRLEVMLALASQLFFLPDEESHIQALSPLLDILEYEDIEQVHTLLRMLRNTVQRLSYTQESYHAHQTAQGLLRFVETLPTEYDRKHKQEWLQATDNLFKLIKYSSSPELLAKINCLCGWGYLWLKEYLQALTSFEHALEIDSRSATAYDGLGWAHSCLKEYWQAVDNFNHGLQLAPYYSDLYLGRGRAYGRLKAYQQALSDLDHALQLDWRLIHAYSNRGRIYMELKEYGKALADWDRVLQVAPEHPLAGRIQFRRGCIYLWLTDLLQANTCFTRSHELAPTQDIVLWAMEWSAMCQTYPGLQTLQHLKVIAGGDSYTAYVCRGVILWLQKEFKQALTELQHATTLHYDENWQDFQDFDYWREWDTHFWVGMVYISLYQEEEARIAIEKALALEMPPILLKPLSWFERERPELYEKFVKPLLDTYKV